MVTSTTDKTQPKMWLVVMIIEQSLRYDGFLCVQLVPSNLDCLDPTVSPLAMAEPHSFSLVSVIPLVSDWATAQHSYDDHSLASNGKQPETFENVN